MRIVLTGANGFIGSRLVERLAPSHEIWCLDRKKGPARENVTRITSDLAASSLPDGLPDRADAVIHMAQSRRYRVASDEAREVFAVNTSAAVRLADWAIGHGVRTFVLLSTGSVYGPSDAPLHEDRPIPCAEGPLAVYKASKHAAEILLGAYGDRLTVVVLRPFFVYGPGLGADMLMARLVEKVRQGRPVQLHSPHGIRLNPVYLDDMTAALERALELDQGATINVAGPDLLNLEDIAQLIGVQVKTKPVFETIDGQTPPHMVADTGRMQRKLGPAEVSFAEGLAKWFEPEAP